MKDLIDKSQNFSDTRIKAWDDHSRFFSVTTLHKVGLAAYCYTGYWTDN